MEYPHFDCLALPLRCAAPLAQSTLGARASAHVWTRPNRPATTGGQEPSRQARWRRSGQATGSPSRAKRLAHSPTTASRDPHPKPMMGPPIRPGRLRNLQAQAQQPHTLSCFPTHMRALPSHRRIPTLPSLRTRPPRRAILCCTQVSEPPGQQGRKAQVHGSMTPLLQPHGPRWVVRAPPLVEVRPQGRTTGSRGARGRLARSSRSSGRRK